MLPWPSSAITWIKQNKFILESCVLKESILVHNFPVNFLSVNKTFFIIPNVLSYSCMNLPFEKLWHLCVLDHVFQYLTNITDCQEFTRNLYRGVFPENTQCMLLCLWFKTLWINVCFLTVPDYLYLALLNVFFILEHRLMEQFLSGILVVLWQVEKKYLASHVLDVQFPSQKWHSKFHWLKHMCPRVQWGWKYVYKASIRSISDEETWFRKR